MESNALSQFYARKVGETQREIQRLEELGIPYRLREQHTDADAHVRRWASNPGPTAASG